MNLIKLPKNDFSLVLMKTTHGDRELQNRIPVFEEPETKVFNLCKTVNCIAVYGITISNAGTFPRQNP